MALLKLLKIHDLTYSINPGMQVYSGEPEPKFESLSTIETEGIRVTRITLGSHTGTHVDAQSHFLPRGNGIDKEPLDKFVGEAVIIDASDRPGEGIAAKDLDRYKVKRNDIVLLYTDTGSRRIDFSYLEVSAAEWIVRHAVKCVGIDTLSVEKYGRKDALVHKMLLANNIGIVENLDNLQQFVGKRLFFVCLPLPLKGVDGSPARAVLLEMIK
jgi:arylformamidase